MRRCIAGLLLGALLPLSASAQPPAPINGTRFAFPGAVPAAASGVSAGLALADRWLADDPFSNPALARGRAIVVSPLIQRVSRQDLRANNRPYDDTSGYIDLAGAWGALPLGRLELLAYVDQPELRLEDAAYTLGRGIQPGLSASVKTHASAREIRAGAGLATAAGPARVGAAIEWTRRRDEYTYHEMSGSPQAGDQSVTFDGSALGAQLGACARWPWGPRTLDVGGEARFVPRLALDGTQKMELISGSSETPLHGIRASAWEGGLAARVTTGETFRVLASVGGRGAQAWEGLGATSGARFEWKVAGEFHDPRDPWTLRFGGGEERQSDVPEPRAGVFSLGFGWRFTSASLDVGLAHRTLARAGQPNSFDDRVVASLSVR